MKEKFCNIYERPWDNSLILRELLEMKGEKAKCSIGELTEHMAKQITGIEGPMDGKHTKSRLTLFLLIKEMEINVICSYQMGKIKKFKNTQYGETSSTFMLLVRM